MRCRQDFASSDEFRIVCLQRFCFGLSDPFILPTFPKKFPYFSPQTFTGMCPHFPSFDVLTVPDRRTIDPSSTYSASCPLTTSVVDIAREWACTHRDRRTRMLSAPLRKGPQPKQLYFEVASFVLTRASCLQSGLILK